MYVAAVAKTAAKLPLPQPEEGVKEDTKKAPEKVPPEDRQTTKLEERMGRDKRDLGDLQVYRRRRQGKYAQESEEEQEPQMGVSREPTGVCKKESQKSLEKEKKEKEKRKKESPGTKERKERAKTKVRVKEREERQRQRQEGQRQAQRR